MHTGKRSEASAASFGYYFDGFYNFEHIVANLVLHHDFAKATTVVLTGESAGTARRARAASSSALTGGPPRGCLQAGLAR